MIFVCIDMVSRCRKEKVGGGVLSTPPPFSVDGIVMSEAEDRTRLTRQQVFGRLAPGVWQYWLSGGGH